MKFPCLKNFAGFKDKNCWAYCLVKYRTGEFASGRKGEVMKGGINNPHSEIPDPKLFIHC